MYNREVLKLRGVVTRRINAKTTENRAKEGIKEEKVGFERVEPEKNLERTDK